MVWPSGVRMLPRFSTVGASNITRPPLAAASVAPGSTVTVLAAKASASPSKLNAAWPAAC